MGKYAYSLDGEVFHLASDVEYEAHGQAAEAAMKSNTMHYYLAPTTPFTHEHFFIDAETLIEHMQIRAFDETFEDISADYLMDISGEKIKQLDELLQSVVLSWLNRNADQPSFYQLGDIGHYDVFTGIIKSKGTDEKER